MKIHPNLNVHYHYKSHTYDKYGNKTPLSESSFPNRYEYLKHKYQDVFTPQEQSSTNNGKIAFEIISKKYPFHLNEKEKMSFVMGFGKDANTSDFMYEIEKKEFAKKQQMYKNLDPKTKEEYQAFVKDVQKMYPVFDNKLLHDDASEKLYNSSVLEALESGYSIEDAKHIASEAKDSYFGNVRFITGEEMIGSDSLLAKLIKGDYKIDLEELKKSQKAIEEKYGIRFASSDDLYNHSTPEAFADEEITEKYGETSKFYMSKNDDVIAKSMLEQIQECKSLLNTTHDEKEQKNLHRSIEVALLAKKVFEKHGVFNERIDIST